MLDRLVKGANRLSLYAVWASGAMMIFAAFMVTFDVLIRTFANTTLGGADEISGYLFGIATAWSLPYALLHRANVRIDAVYMLLPRPAKASLDLLGLVLLSIFAGIVTWRGVALVLDSWSINKLSVTPLHVPLVIPQSFWVAGWLLFCGCLLLLVLAVVQALFRRDLQRVQALAGTPTIEEEIREEGFAPGGTPPGEKAHGEAPQRERVLQ